MKWPFRIVTVLLAAALLAGVTRSRCAAPRRRRRGPRRPGPARTEGGRRRSRARSRALHRVGARRRNPRAHRSARGGRRRARDGAGAAPPAPEPAARSAIAPGRRAAAGLGHRRAAAGGGHGVARRDGRRAGSPRARANGRAWPRTGSLPPAQLEQAAADARMREAELASARFSAEGRRARHRAGEGGARAVLAGRAARPSSSRSRRPSTVRCCTFCTRARGSSRRGRRSSRWAIRKRWSWSSTCCRRTPSSFDAGMPARLLHWGGELPLTAKVRRVEPSAFTKTSALGVDEQRVNVVLDPEGPPGRVARRSATASRPRSRSPCGRSRTSVQVPTSALFRQGRRDGRSSW